MYVLVTRKSVRHVALLGTVEVPLASIKRSETIESWFPIISPDNIDEHYAGELMLSIKTTETVVLPPTEYGQLRVVSAHLEAVCFVLNCLGQMLADLSDTDILYDIASHAGDLETAAELLLRIAMSQGTLLSRLKQMVELEIDGDETTANILFRGNTLFTKTVELHLRLIGHDLLHCALGEVVGALCSEEVELEIDPTRLQPNAKVRGLEDNISELTKWTTYLWNSLYQSRHKCPKSVVPGVAKLAVVLIVNTATCACFSPIFKPS